MQTSQPLDLLTPLVEGVRQGSANANAQADRGERIRADKAREDEMKQRLGLEEKAQNFQQSMWTSQGEMRAAQLDLTKNQAAESANSLANVVQDHSSLTEGMGALDKLAAQNDFNSILNAPPPSFLTPQASQAYEQHRNQLLQTGVGQSAAMHQNAQLAIQKADIDTQTEQLRQVGQIPNADVNSFYDNAPDGSKVWNKGRAAQAINQFVIGQEKAKAENSATTLAATIRAQQSMYNTDTRNATNQSKVNMEGLTQALSVAQKAVATAAKGSDAKAFSKAQADYARAQANLDAAVSGQGSAQQPPAPTAQSPTDWLNSLGQ